MSGRTKKKSRNKSGMLTGLMIVSTGLIAGFQGFELAMPENNNSYDNQKNTNRPATGPSQKSTALQTRSVEQLIKASYEPEPKKTDRQGLVNLIQSTNRLAEIEAPVTNNGPVVNHALKRDRGQAPDRRYRDALLSIQQANKQLQKPKPVAPLVAPAPAKVTLAKAAPKHKAPDTDSTDIALFAADMPLPAKLVFSGSRGKRMPSLPGRYARGFNGSPLVPRKFRTGKAFGGLAEREFQKRERRCMTTALYFEARSEPESGQIAVGQVVMNRVRSPDYPDTICGVVYQGSNRRTGCQFSFTCDGKADKPNNKRQWERSKRLANQVLEGQIWLKSIGHATHYHADYVKPRWRRKMYRLKKIGRHIFYKAPKVSVTETYQRYISGKRS